MTSPPSAALIRSRFVYGSSYAAQERPRPMGVDFKNRSNASRSAWLV
jgi:hypothetical protein